jgi:hypothetical protein
MVFQIFLVFTESEAFSKPTNTKNKLATYSIRYSITTNPASSLSNLSIESFIRFSVTRFKTLLESASKVKTHLAWHTFTLYISTTGKQTNNIHCIISFTVARRYNNGPWAYWHRKKLQRQFHLVTTTSCTPLTTAAGFYSFLLEYTLLRLTEDPLGHYWVLSVSKWLTAHRVRMFFTQCRIMYI